LELADQTVQVFSWRISRDVDLLWLVLITGTLGSFVYIARSFVDFVGNKSIRGSWGVWYLMYPLIGSALALIFRDQVLSDRGDNWRSIFTVSWRSRAW
jgi:hypothetical protein